MLFKQFEDMKKQDPQEMLNKLLKTPEQKQQFSQYAKGFGITEEQLKQYGINS